MAPRLYRSKRRSSDATHSAASLARIKANSIERSWALLPDNATSASSRSLTIRRSRSAMHSFAVSNEPSRYRSLNGASVVTTQARPSSSVAPFLNPRGGESRYHPPAAQGSAATASSIITRKTTRARSGPTGFTVQCAATSQVSASALKASTGLFLEKTKRIRSAPSRSWHRDFCFT